MLLRAINDFDKFLYQEHLKFEAYIIGGAALTILNVISRMTEDIDCIDPEIPPHIKKASIEFIQNNPQYGLNPAKFLNNGPISILKTLPSDWRLRSQIIYQGNAITFWTLGKIDLLKTKLDAMVQRGRDFEDVVAMAPTREELEECRPWVLSADGGEFWPQMVEESFERLIERLYGKT